MMSAFVSATPSPARLTWLHLSDFHLRVSTGWAQDAVLSTMLTDIRSRYGGVDRPDIAFLTGDLAFSGKEEEYRFAEDFVRKLCSSINLPIERLCMVPGNHDIDLSREEDAVAGARQLLKSPTEVDRFFGNEGRRKTLFARQAEFRDFANRVLGPITPTYSPTSYAHVRMLQVGALRVRVLLLDSTWLADGGPSDAGELLVGERQVLDCAEPDDECLTFALLHHPFAWLREFEQVSVENLIARSAQICLRGHVHAPDLRATDGPHGRLTTFTAGAAFQTRTADNTYVWCSLDLTTGFGEKVVHRYRHAEHRWEAGAREPWAFFPDPPPPSDLAFIRKALLAARTRYASYVTCLIGNLQTEVPFLLTDRRLAFVACGARLPASENRCGDLILRVRNHFHWKRVWESGAWEAQLTTLAAELGSIFEQVETIAPNALHSRDENSASLLLAFAEPLGVTSTACDEIRQLLREGDLERARAVLERWRGQDILRPDETRELSRLEIFLLLGEQKASDANSRAVAFIASADRTPDDVALAARCAFDAKEHQRAATLMHEALNLGVAIDSVKSIARAIAGAAGDKQLAERVL
jgi:predicted phosphodiesterase